jgi:hypothetical protein
LPGAPPPGSTPRDRLDAPFGGTDPISSRPGTCYDRRAEAISPGSSKEMAMRGIIGLVLTVVVIVLVLRFMGVL